jgi:hypothetical protein
MKTTAIVLIVSFFTLSASHAFAQDSLQWRKVAESIPLGTKVKVQTLDGKRVNGTLLSVDGTSVQVKRNTRRPEPAVSVAFASISNMERDTGGGMSWGKAVGIGLGAGAGVILTIFIIALQLD